MIHFFNFLYISFFLFVLIISNCLNIFLCTFALIITILQTIYIYVWFLKCLVFFNFHYLWNFIFYMIFHFLYSLSMKFHFFLFYLPAECSWKMYYFLKKFLKLNFAKLHYIRNNLVSNYISKIFTHEICHITNGVFYEVFFSSLCAHNMLNLRKQIDCYK